MKKIVYIRHGEDKKSSYKYDEKLTSNGKRMAKRLASKLLEDYGLPDVIYYSPYYRTRQTRKNMIKAIVKYRNELDEDDENKYKTVDLRIEPRLGRFFTKKEKRNPDIHSTTLYKGAIINETWGEFHERVEDHMNEIFSNEYYVIWNITHTLVLLRVAKIKNIERDSHVDYLDTVILKND